MFDPSVGRFTAEDPLGVPSAPNPYAYADDEPTDFTDPSGLQRAPGQPPTPDGGGTRPPGDPGTAKVVETPAPSGGGDGRGTIVGVEINGERLPPPDDLPWPTRPREIPRPPTAPQPTLGEVVEGIYDGVLEFGGGVLRGVRDELAEQVDPWTTLPGAYEQAMRLIELYRDPLRAGLRIWKEILLDGKPHPLLAKAKQLLAEFKTDPAHAAGRLLALLAEVAAMKRVAGAAGRIGAKPPPTGPKVVNDGFPTTPKNPSKLPGGVEDPGTSRMARKKPNPQQRREYPEWVRDQGFEEIPEQPGVFRRKSDGAILDTNTTGERGKLPHYDLELPDGRRVKVDPDTGVAQGNKNYLKPDYVDPDTGGAMNSKQQRARDRRDRMERDRRHDDDENGRDNDRRQNRGRREDDEEGAAGEVGISFPRHGTVLVYHRMPSPGPATYRGGSPTGARSFGRSIWPHAAIIWRTLPIPADNHHLKRFI